MYHETWSTVPKKLKPDTYIIWGFLSSLALVIFETSITSSIPRNLSMKKLQAPSATATQGLLFLNGALVQCSDSHITTLVAHGHLIQLHCRRSEPLYGLEVEEESAGTKALYWQSTDYVFAKWVHLFIFCKRCNFPFRVWMKSGQNVALLNNCLPLTSKWCTWSSLEVCWVLMGKWC